MKYQPYFSIFFQISWIVRVLGAKQNPKMKIVLTEFFYKALSEVSGFVVDIADSGIRKRT
jgi:hypothetical protein